MSPNLINIGTHLISRDPLSGCDPRVQYSVQHQEHIQVKVEFQLC